MYICTLYFRQLSVLCVQLLPAPRAALLLLAVLLPSYVVSSTTEFSEFVTIPPLAFRPPPGRHGRP